MNIINKGAFAALALALVACVPPPVIDQPASNLDVKLVILDTTANPSGNMVPVAAQISFDGAVSQLGGGASVACNGVALGWNGLLGSYAGDVTLASSFSFAHTRNGVTTTATVTAPAARPQILSPAPGAVVTRSTSLTLMYQQASSDGVRGLASDGTTGVDGNVQADNGRYTGLDVTRLHPGPGTVGLTREITGTLNGTGFQSATSDYTIGSPDVHVTWQ